MGAYASIIVEVFLPHQGLQMQNFAKVIAASEDWLMERVLSYAQARGYTKYTTTLKEAWRLSINGLSEALLRALTCTPEAMELGAEDTYGDDPASAFAVAEARLHRIRGISLGMFLGLLKYYRQSYLDLVDKADLAGEAHLQAKHYLERFFDRVEVAIASEWCSLSEQGKHNELREANRSIVLEKNRYQTLFETLSTPVVFINSEGFIQNLNIAAISWLGQTAMTEAVSPQLPGLNLGHAAQIAAFRGRSAVEVFTWLEQPLKRILQDGETRLSYLQHLGEGESARDIIATISAHKNLGGTFEGFVLVVQDVTELTRSREKLSQTNRLLETEVQLRTKDLEETNARLKGEVRERELYQQALTESASLYRAVVEDQGELICRFRPDGTILFANMAYTRIFGSRLVSDAEGPHLILHEGEQRSLKELLALLTKARPVQSFEQRATAPSGQTVWYSWTCRGIFSATGLLEACQLVGEDVTRARAAEQALRELNESLERTVQERTEKLDERAQSFERMNKNLQMQIESRKRAELALAKAAEEQQIKVRQITALYGLAEALGTHWASVQEMLAKAVGALQLGWRSQGSTAGEIVFDGQAYRSRDYQDDCECLVRPLTVLSQERGSVKICSSKPCEPGNKKVFKKDEEALLTSMARQIERSLEAHLSHLRLSQSEREFREFFDNAAEAIFIHDEQGRIMDVNKNAGIWLNLPTDGLVGLNLLDFTAVEDRENMAGRFLNSLRETPEVFQVTLRRKDGFAIPLELLCQAQDYQGRKVLISSGRNISKRQQAEAEAQRRMDQELLLSGISSRLVNAIGVEVPSAMTDTLAEICGFLGMQRAAIYHYDESKKRFELSHQWHAEDLPALPKELKHLGRIKTPWLFERSMTQEWLTIRDVEHLPPAAHKEKRLLSGAGVSCLTAIPMSIRGRLQGLFMVACQNSTALSLPDPQLLLQFAPMFSNVMLRQHIRTALNENVSLTSSILNALSTYLCVLDKHGVITLVNRAWRQHGDKTGPAVAASLSVGGDYLDFCRKAAELGDKYAAAIHEGISSVLTGQSSLFQLEFSSRSGPALRWYLLEATPSGKGVRGAVVSHLNITAKKRAEQRLSRNETRYRTLIEALHEGLLMIRKGGIMAYLNDQFARMLGWPRSTLLGRRPEDYVAAESLSRLKALLSPGIETRHAEEIIWNHASGRHVYTLVSSSAALDEEGNVMGTFAVVTDTTERKGLESQLLQSQKLEAIGQLAAGIAHEINTPAQYVGNNIRFIKGAFEEILLVCGKTHEFMQAAQKDRPTNEDVAALAEFMAERDIEYLEAEVPGAIAQTLEGIERISTIVRSVKQFAHPGALVMAPADLNEAMRSTVTVSRNEWKYVAELDTELDENLPPVVCMVGEINQVVLNLIVNASHAIADAIENDPQRKGHITLTTRHAPPWAEIRVTDTGTGIPPEVQAKIFDPFFTTKEVGKGTGQGLTISRSIVMEKHGGQLYFETEPGVGTTFVVRLPLAQSGESK